MSYELFLSFSYLAVLVIISATLMHTIKSLQRTEADLWDKYLDLTTKHQRLLIEHDLVRNTK